MDDSHFRDNAMDGFGCRVMVKAQENTPDALLTALKAGRYYASQGPVIEDITRDGGTLHVRCSAASEIILLGNVGMATHVAGTAVTGAALSLDRFESGWCRLVIRDAAGRHAWSNPFWIDT